MCKISGSSSLKNGVDNWIFVRQSAKITAFHRNYLVLVDVRFWVLNIMQYWSYAVSSSNIYTKLCTNMPWRIWKWLVQTYIYTYIYIYSHGKRLSSIDLFEGL